MAKSKSNPDTLSFQCINCKSKLKVKMALAGRYIACPKCQKKIPVPSSQAEADDEIRDYMVKELAYDIPKRCTKCNARMPKGSVFCTSCGFDYRKGRQTELEDHTLKEGEPTRGKIALKAMVSELILMVAGIIWLFIRGRDAFWYEFGGVIGIAVFLAMASIAHFRQWLDYHELPIRESPTRQDEDRAEREEAREPLGKQTMAILFLLVAGGVGLGYIGHPWMFPDTPPVAKRPVPAAPAAPAEVRPAMPVDVDPNAGEYIMTQLEAGQFGNTITDAEYLKTYARTASIFRESISAQDFTAAVNGVLQGGRFHIIYADVLALKPPRLTDPDFIYDEKLPPAERKQKVLVEVGGPSSAIPVENRLSWVSVEIAPRSELNDQPPKFRLLLLMVRDGDRARVAYMQIRSTSDPHPLADQ